MTAASSDTGNPGNPGKGTLNLVSVGPGHADLIVPRAVAALRDSDVIVGYELYLRWIASWIAGKEIHTPPLTKERERAMLAIEKARGGARVALISSGDIGIYAMAALAYEEMREDDTFAVNLVPGVTSANACASLLGSPLSHDFATLSLSDLLCPWQWIVDRARHIAQADLACVFYNVQSAARQEGVYRILRVMLESKAPHTLCGVVRNAYRPDQHVAIHRLDELPGLQFDMLTTIVIGNRYTQRKRDWIFTPRGYNDWKMEGAEVAAVNAVAAVAANASDAVAAQTQGVALSDAAVDGSALPSGAVWVFSGTGDGNALAAAVAANGYPVVVSAATAHGGELALRDCPGATVFAGRHGMQARRNILATTGARVLLDATHPYATIISEQLMALSLQLGIPYLRYERSSGLPADDGSSGTGTGTGPGPGKSGGTGNAAVTACGDMAQAAELAMAAGHRIFLATGSKDLAQFLKAPHAARHAWFARITAEPEFIQRALDLGLPQSHLCAMQGPFSEAFNVALWRDWQIDCVVTKDSGDAGGFPAKQAAAAALGIPLIVVRRPVLAYPALSDDTADVLQRLAALQTSRVAA